MKPEKLALHMLYLWREEQEKKREEWGHGWSEMESRLNSTKTLPHQVTQ